MAGRKEQFRREGYGTVLEEGNFGQLVVLFCSSFYCLRPKLLFSLHLVPFWV